MQRSISQLFKYSVLASALVLVNCGSSSTTTGSGTGTGTGGNGAGGSTSTSSATDNFVGVWKFSSGTSTPACPSLTIAASTLTGNIQICLLYTSDAADEEDSV